MAAETIEIDIAANFKDNATPGAQKAAASVDKFITKLQKAKQQTDRLGNTTARPKIDVLDKATSTINKITSGLKGLGGKTFRTTVKILDLATSPLRAIKNTLFSIKGLVAAVTAGFAANQLFNKPIGIADTYSSAKIGFQTLLGEQQGQEMMDKLDQFAKATPFNTSQVIQNAQKMIGMGWDASHIIDDMKIIGDAAAATGKGEEGMSRIVLALSQIKTKGKLSTEELNQLAESGIRAKGYLAEGLGYGTGDESLMALSKDLEKGEIGAEAAIEAIMKGLKEYDGMMDKTANETVSGLKSQIEDAFEINIFRRWGQGLQDGAKRGLGSVVTLLDESEDGLKKVGNYVHDIGAELSNWAADKLEGAIDKIITLMDKPEFKEASVFGKAKIIWDEVIAEPFDEWWDTKGQDYFMNKFESGGKSLGKGLSTMFKALFGIVDVDVNGDAVGLGGSFSKGFVEGFDAEGVADAFTNALKTGLSKLFSGSWLSNLILGGLVLKGTGTILNGVSAMKNIWYGSEALAAVGGAGGMVPVSSAAGLRGLIGSTGTAMVGGSGLLGSMANVGYGITGGAAGSALTGGAAALIGGASIAGAVGGIAGLTNSLNDTRKALNASTENDKRLYGTRAAVKGGMTGAGAATGAAIGAIFGGVGAIPGALIGAGIGGIATFLTGNKLADGISGVSKSTAQLREEAQSLKAENMAKAFGDWNMSAEELSHVVTDVIGEHNLSRLEKFRTETQNLANAEKQAAQYYDSISYTSQRIINKEELSADDINEYADAILNYSSSIGSLIQADKKSTRAAYQVLYKDDATGLTKATEGINKLYSKMEKQLETGNKQLQDTMSKALEDGIITGDENEIIQKSVAKIQKIEETINQQIRKERDAETKASYDLIEKKYSNMSIDSYKTLIKELSAQNKEAFATADEAYIKAKAKLDLQLETKSINDTQYKKTLSEIEEKYLQSTSEPLKKSVDISMDVLVGNYESEFKKVEKTLQNNDLSKLFSAEQINYNLGGSWTGKNEKMFQGIRDSFLEGMGVSEEIQVQMADYYSQLAPQREQLESLKSSYEELGKSVPEWITESLKNIEDVGILSGSMEPFYNMIGEEIARSNGDLAQKLSATTGVPEALKQGIINGLGENLDSAAAATQEALDEAFNKGFETKAPTTVQPTLNSLTGINPFMSEAMRTLTNSIITQTINVPVKVKPNNGGGGSEVKSAEGRITTGPMLSWIGEDGQEAIIPLGAKRRSRGLALWKEAGRRLGVLNNANGGIYGESGSTVGDLLRQATESSINTPVSTQKAHTDNIQVEVGGITIQITGSGNTAPEEIINNKDQICNTIAIALQEAFQNLPLAE